ncbi:hypothetical protein ACFE04_010857 [Oxalis oulophora]
MEITFAKGQVVDGELRRSARIAAEFVALFLAELEGAPKKLFPQAIRWLIVLAQKPLLHPFERLDKKSESVEQNRTNPNEKVSKIRDEGLKWCLFGFVQWLDSSMLGSENGRHNWLKPSTIASVIVDEVDPFLFLSATPPTTQQYPMAFLKHPKALVLVILIPLLYRQEVFDYTMKQIAKDIYRSKTEIKPLDFLQHIGHIFLCHHVDIQSMTHLIKRQFSEIYSRSCHLRVYPQKVQLASRRLQRKVA